MEDVAQRRGAWGGDAVEQELNRLIERRARKGEVNPDEQEEIWKASVRAHNDRQREEIRAAWCEHHQGQAARLRATLQELISYHETRAQRLLTEGEA